MQVTPEMFDFEFFPEDIDVDMEEFYEDEDERCMEREIQQQFGRQFGIPDMQGIGSWMESFPMDKIKRFEVKDRKGYKKIIIEIEDDLVIIIKKKSEAQKSTAPESPPAPPQEPNVPPPPDKR